MTNHEDIQLDLWGNPIGPAAPERFQSLEEYEAFTEKFKPKKTTDDCYTPPAVYAAVCAFLRESLGVQGEFVRPFWPGGDYERYPYPEGCVVVDNPPFSIYSKIVRFYLSQGIRFFLFGPALTLMVYGCEATYVITDSELIYENGAKVRTGFVTNLIPGLRVWLCPDLKERIDQANVKSSKQQPKIRFPDCVATSATLGKIINQGVELKIYAEECIYTKDCGGRNLFGGGLFLSAEAEARRREAEARRREAEADHYDILVKLAPHQIKLIEKLNGKQP